MGNCVDLILFINQSTMATIRFIVKSSRKGQPATIYLRFRSGRKTDIIVPTPEIISPEYWSNKTESFKQRIMNTEVFTEKDKVRMEEQFARLKDFVIKEHNNLKGGDPSKEWLKSVIDKCYDKRVAGCETLNQFIERFIQEAKAGTRLSTSQDNKRMYAAETIKSIKNFQTQFNEYQGIYTEKRLKELKEKDETPRPRKIINFNDVTIDMYNDLVNYFYGKNYSPNSIGRAIKTFKGLMRQAREEGLHSNTETERKSFKSIREQANNIYLNESELKKMFDLDLSNDPSLDVARDVFLIGCYTAQRYSDYSHIKADNIRIMENGKKVIDLYQKKTGEKVIIPVRHELETILQKYNYTVPKSYEQKVNDRIKKIGERAGITEPVELEQTKGGLRKKTTIQKCKLIVTHTARRSGCTNMYLAGINTVDIMKLSGHRTTSEFMKYIKVSKEETARSLSDHKYFIGNTLSIAK